MDETGHQLRVELSETALACAPSRPAATTCTVYNLGLIVDEYRLRVAGLDPAWVQVPPVTPRIFPGATAAVSVAFDPSPSAPAGAHPFRVVAESADNPALTAEVAGVLTVGPYAAFAFDLASPRAVEGEGEATYTLRLSNGGNARLTLQLEAADEAGALVYAFDEPRPVLAPGEERPIRFTARPRQPALDGGGTFRIDLRARLAEVVPPLAEPIRIEPQHLTVTFRLTPAVQPPPRLDPQRVELVERVAQTSLILTNRAATEVTVALEAVDPAQALAFEFGGGPWRAIAPGQTATVPVRITCLRRDRLARPPSPMTFSVTVTPITPRGEPRTVQGELVLPPPPNVRLGLEPEWVELAGPVARLEVVLANRGGEPVAVALDATDRAKALTFAFAGERVRAVSPGQTVRVPLEIGCENRARLAAPPTATAFTVTATPVDPPGEPSTAQGELAAPAPADVRLRVEPGWVELTDAPVRTSVELTSRDYRSVTVVLEASDKAEALAFEFGGGDRRTVRPGEAVDVPMLITCRDRARFATAPDVFTVTATPVEPPGEPRTAEGRAALPRAAEFWAWLEPERVEGSGAAHVQLAVENLGGRTATFAIAARRKDAGLDVAVTVARLAVEPHALGTVAVDLVPREAVPLADEPRILGFALRVAPVDAPAAVQEVTGEYALTPATISVRLAQREMEASGEATFDVQVENLGKRDVAVALNAEEPSGACAFAFDPQRLVVAAGAVIQSALTVTPPSEHAADARWPFDVVASPTAPAGPPTRTDGVLIYAPPRVAVRLRPSEVVETVRRGVFSIEVENLGGGEVAVELSAVGADGWCRFEVEPARLTVRPRAVAHALLTVYLYSPHVRWPFEVRAQPPAPGAETARTEGVFVYRPPRPPVSAASRSVAPPPRQSPGRLLLVVALLVGLGLLGVEADWEWLAFLVAPLVGGLLLRTWWWSWLYPIGLLVAEYDKDGVGIAMNDVNIAMLAALFALVGTVAGKIRAEP